MAVAINLDILPGYQRDNKEDQNGKNILESILVSERSNSCSQKKAWLKNQNMFNPIYKIITRKLFGLF